MGKAEEGSAGEVVEGSVGGVGGARGRLFLRPGAMGGGSWWRGG